MRNKPTIEEYKEAGAWLRICQEVISRAWYSCSAVLKTRDSDRFEPMSYEVKMLAAKGEGNMNRDYPEYWLKAPDIFFGELRNIPQTDIEIEQLRIIKGLIEDMLGDNLSKQEDANERL